MAVRVDANVEPYYNVTFILCSLVFCEDCGREAVYGSGHPEHSDENYYDQALVLRAEGWVVLADGLHVRCPECGAAAKART